MYRFVEHTGELELQIEAPNEQGIYEEALHAFGELLVRHSPDIEASDGYVSFEVVASAADRPALLVEWLNELIYLAETEYLIPERIVSLRLSENHLEATVSGQRGQPAHLVKAVTYHQLMFEQTNEGWQATLVFDV